MTILPKKKTPQQGSNQENDNGESSNSGGVHVNQLSHHQQLPSNLPNHIQSVGSPGVREECSALSPRPPAQHYDDDRASGASSPAAAAAVVAVAVHNKRRASYRASPLRSVRPKLREHRVGGGGGGGGASPPYSVNSPLSHSIPPHKLTPLSLQPLPTSSHPSLPPPLSPQAGPSNESSQDDDGSNSGYNSGDEYQPMTWNLTPQEWVEKERWFEKRMKKKGLVIKQMLEDGACLFRAIADQVYGDQDMHDIVRKNCMDYLESNQDMFAPFVSENFQTYVSRKRQHDVFGNHIEIAAMSEMYNRVIEVYCYSPEPINIFQSSAEVGTENPCIRLSYHRGTHYNSLYDPYKPSCGVGLGMPNLVPGLADNNLMKEATRQSENFHIEQAMLEDKIRATDYEATAEAIEEQVASASYLDYLRDIDKRNKQHRVGSSSCSSSSGQATSQSADAIPRPADPRTSPPPPPPIRPTATHVMRNSPRSSPPHALRNSPPISSRSERSSPRNSPPHHTREAARNSPRNSPPHHSRETVSRSSPRNSPPHHSRESARSSPRNSPRYDARNSPRGSASPKSKNSSGHKSNKNRNSGGATNSCDMAVPGSSKDPGPSSSNRDEARVHHEGDFAVDERASFLNHLSPDMFGLSDYSRDEFTVLAQVLAASQQEYLDSLKRNKDTLTET